MKRLVVTAGAAGVLAAAGCVLDVVPPPPRPVTSVAAPEVLLVRGTHRDGSAGWRCSGVALHNGYVVATASHCFGNPRGGTTHTDYAGVRVQTVDGREARTYDCELPDPAVDVVYCTVDRHFPPSHTQPLATIPLGMPVYNAGWGCAQHGVPVEHASELATRGPAGHWRAGRTDPPGCPGDSGGPAYTADGRVFGLATGVGPSSVAGYGLPPWP